MQVVRLFDSVVLKEGVDVADTHCLKKPQSRPLFVCQSYC